MIRIKKCAAKMMQYLEVTTRIIVVVGEMVVEKMMQRVQDYLNEK